MTRTELSKYKRSLKRAKQVHKEALSIHYDRLTSEQRKAARTQLFIKQDGCCAICGQAEKDLSRQLSLDHCHIRGHIRGLLCGQCNTLLGFAKDNVNILREAVDYLTGSRNSGCRL